MASFRPRVFLDVNIGQTLVGRLTIELFTDKTPKTCENFRQLCTGEHDGLSYSKVPFHRVIHEFMIQGGDIDKQDGTGTASIYGGEFSDENLDWREMDAAGLVCSANRGRDTNGSQFFVTLVPCEHLTGRHTIFGRLVTGQDVLDKIAGVDVDKDDRPLEPVLIAHCNELEKKKKRADPAIAPQAPQDDTNARGRRRKSGDSDHEMEDTPEPPRRRRQSDNIIDEGLRGRPRIRSGSRSDSRPLSTPEEDDERVSTSPTQMHKRKRSPSPSRPKHADKATSREEERRRRRSLPNQYDSDRHRGVRGDESRYQPSPRREDYRPARGRFYEDRRDGGGGGESWRPSHRRDKHEDDGRLVGDGRLGGGGGGGDGYDPPVKYKGRGTMMYREPGRL